MVLKEPTLEETDNFYKKKALIQKIILQTIKNKEIIYGEQAVKVRVPKHLQRETTDYDVYSRTPKKDAIEAEKKLDKGFGGDYFYVEPAEHEGTYKVRSRINGKGYADFTKPTRDYGSDKIYQHSGFSISITTSFNSQAARPWVGFRWNKSMGSRLGL